MVNHEEYKLLNKQFTSENSFSFGVMSLIREGVSETKTTRGLGTFR